MRIVGSALASALLLAAAGCASYPAGPGRPYPPAPAYRPPYPPRYSYQPPPPPPAPQDRDWRVSRRQGETDYELSERILFGLDSAHISDRAEPVLAEIAQAARDQPNAMLIVEGHTDTSGTWEHNQELSDARADAVAIALERQGVDRDRIRSEGLGKSGLAVQTGDGVREPRNRRVVIRLVDNPRRSYDRDAYMRR